MGFDYKEKLAKHESQQGTVVPPAPLPLPRAAASSTDPRAQPPRHPVPGGPLGHLPAPGCRLVPLSLLVFFSPVTCGVCVWQKQA